MSKNLLKKKNNMKTVEAFACACANCVCVCKCDTVGADRNTPYVMDSAPYSGSSTVSHHDK